MVQVVSMIITSAIGYLIAHYIVQAIYSPKIFFLQEGLIYEYRASHSIR
ncbi:hypothetical protein ACTQKJ_03935 [Eggerthellaceae bacterium PR-HUZ602407-17]